MLTIDDIFTSEEHRELFNLFEDHYKATKEEIKVAGQKLLNAAIKCSFDRLHDNIWIYYIMCWCHSVVYCHDGPVYGCPLLTEEEKNGSDSNSELDCVIKKAKKLLRTVGHFNHDYVRYLAHKNVGGDNEDIDVIITGILLLNETNKYLNKYKYEKISIIPSAHAERIKNIIHSFSGKVMFEKYPDEIYYCRQCLFISSIHHAALGSKHPCEMISMYYDSDKFIKYAEETMVKLVSTQLAGIDWSTMNLSIMGMITYIIADCIDRGDCRMCVNGELVKYLDTGIPKIYAFNDYCQHVDHFGVFFNGVYYIPDKEDTNPYCAVILKWLESTRETASIYTAVTDPVRGKNKYLELVK